MNEGGVWRAGALAQQGEALLAAAAVLDRWRELGPLARQLEEFAGSFFDRAEAERRKD